MVSDLSGRVENYVLRWFGHVKRMDGEIKVKKLYDLVVEGTRVRWRPGSLE